MPVAPQQLVRLTVDKPAAGGRMIARLEGQVVLVGGAIPGERVTARVDRVTKSLVFAETVAVETPSADRRDAFPDAACGGCAYSHIAYPRQLQIKSLVIADAFARIGHIVMPAAVPVARSPEDGYRMRARLHVRGGRIGFFRENTHEVCDARQTRQLLPATCDTLDRVVTAAAALGADVVREIELSENVDATERVIHVDTARPVDRRALSGLAGVEGLTEGPYVSDVLTIGAANVTLRRHVLAFFQGNRYLLRDLVAHVVGQLTPGSKVADLYAGAGLFAVAAATAAGALVVAVESDRYAAEDLRANASAAGDAVSTRRGDVAAVVNGLKPSAKGFDRFDTVIVDPPRTGMSPEALQGVLRLRAPKLIYVSCDVATLARDARRIIDAGHTIARVDAFDLFPNTPHVETVVVFERERSA